jgi:hypothetical protein
VISGVRLRDSVYTSSNSLRVIAVLSTNATTRSFMAEEGEGQSVSNKQVTSNK